MKHGGDEPICDYIYGSYIYGNHNEIPYISLLNKQKMSFFKNIGQEDKTGPIWGLILVGADDDLKKKSKMVNMVEILCIHVRKWKNETC
jgi:hypothetical protein